MNKSKLLIGSIFIILCFFALVLYAEEETLYIESEQFKMFDDRIEFYKASEITKGDFFLKGDTFTIYREDGQERQIIAEDGIYLEFDTGKATSLTLDYDLVDEKGTMTGNVEAIITSSGSTETIIINCDILDIDNETGLFANQSPYLLHSFITVSYI